jgi:hypothetical protein
VETARSGFYLAIFEAIDKKRKKKYRKINRKEKK